MPSESRAGQGREACEGESYSGTALACACSVGRVERQEGCICTAAEGRSE